MLSQIKAAYGGRLMDWEEGLCKYKANHWSTRRQSSKLGLSPDRSEQTKLRLPVERLLDEYLLPAEEPEDDQLARIGECGGEKLVGRIGGKLIWRTG